MKYPILFVFSLFVVFGAKPLFAQKAEKQKLNLTGIWVFDKTVSQYGIIDSGDSKNFVRKLIITHSDSEIKITEQMELSGKVEKSKEMTYFTDGRGETNVGENQEKAESVTRQNNNTITTTFYKTDKKGEKKKYLVIKLAISKDEKTLTINSIDAEFVGSQAQGGFPPLINGSKAFKIFKKEQ